MSKIIDVKEISEPEVVPGLDPKPSTETGDSEPPKTDSGNEKVPMKRGGYWTGKKRPFAPRRKKKVVDENGKLVEKKQVLIPVSHVTRKIIGSLKISFDTYDSAIRRLIKRRTFEIENSRIVPHSNIDELEFREPDKISDLELAERMLNGTHIVTEREFAEVE